MDVDFVGYLCGSLDADERSRTETTLRNDANARARLERVRARLAPLELARDIEEPPAGLADRTLGFITEKVKANRAAEVRPISASSEPVYSSWRWRRIDVAIAASVLILVGGLGLSGVSRVQHRHGVATCQNNMRQMHQSLVSYSQDRGGKFPQVSENNVAGSYIPMLQQAGYLPATGAPSCPGSFVVSAVPVAGGYAYSLGYRDQNGHLFGLCREPDADTLPILADQQEPLNHRGGHNVLYIGGNVRFCTTPKVGVNCDDIFVNQAEAIAAGLHRLDTVLGRGDKSP